MPLTRSPSAGNISNVGNDVEGSGIADGQGTSGAEGSSVSHVTTRRQTQLAAALRSTVSEGQVRTIIKDSLDVFRTELSTSIGSELRDMIVSLGLNQNSANRSGNGIDPNLADSRNLSSDNMSRNVTIQTHTGNTEDERADTRSGDRFAVCREKVSNLINSWHVTFSGTKGDVTVEDFIYRINTLTNIHLNGDFDILCRHAHILFEGQANKWFWRFHRQSSGEFRWVELSQALKRQFQETTTDFDLKDDMRRRKQREHESFDDYLDIIMCMGDRLRIPFSERELIEIVLRNLRTELRYELLHVDITSISCLRSEVRKHEKFKEDLRQWPQRTNVGYKKQVSEVDVDLEEELDGEVDALDSSKIRCWNCELLGHRYQECLAPRRIFCYGCGRLDTYKPNCQICLDKNKDLNLKKDVGFKMGPHPQGKYRK